MTTIDYLEKQYAHAFEMIKFGETKNTVLIAFNGAIIVGMIKLANDFPSKLLIYCTTYVIVMSTISVLLCFTALVAKIKHTPNNIPLPLNENLLYFATLAHMNPEQLLERLKAQYQCEPSNANHEKDLAKQVIIMSQIAARKFKHFNTAIAFMLSGLLTPLCLVVYKIYLDHDK